MSKNTKQIIVSIILLILVIVGSMTIYLHRWNGGYCPTDNIPWSFINAANNTYFYKCEKCSRIIEMPRGLSQPIEKKNSDTTILQ